MPKTSLSNPDRAELSERTFRKYEYIFAEFLETFPEPYRLRAVSGALSTLVVRLREAANAVLANSDKFLRPISFPLEEFRLAWSKVNVSIRGSEVVIADRASLLAVARAQVEEAISSHDFIAISDPTLEELTAFSSVLARHGHSGPFLFTGSVPPFVPPLGVAFEQAPDGWLML